MSKSKLIMVKKLHGVQLKLMGVKIGDDSFESLLSLIFKECYNEKLTFWFNFIENSCVLNLRDVEHENYELNIRYTYDSSKFSLEEITEFKRIVLINTFLITSNVCDVASSKKHETVDETIIIQGDKPVPHHIRKAIDKIQSKGVSVTPEAIQNHLPTGKMSFSQLMECNKYLKQMRSDS